MMTTIIFNIRLVCLSVNLLDKCGLTKSSNNVPATVFNPADMVLKKKRKEMKDVLFKIFKSNLCILLHHPWFVLGSGDPLRLHPVYIIVTLN